MTDQKTDAALFEMVAHSLTASGAPRFLIHLFTQPPGEHRLEIDVEDVSAEGSEAWLMISQEDDGPRIRLSYSSEYPDSAAAGISMPSVWTHILVDGMTFRESKTMEETLPPVFDYEIDLRSLAAGTASVEDLCDACGLSLDPSRVGQAPAAPLESAAPFASK